MRRPLPTILLLCAALSACAGPAGLPEAQKRRADRLISVFENSTQVLQYGYVADLGDGRGYTAGRAGFCSGCGDLAEVVEAFVKKKPDSALSGYLPALRRLGAAHDPSVKELAGFPDDWRRAAAVPAMRAAQDEVSDRLYYRPALKLAAKLGLKSDLAKVALYEAGIQHGFGDDPDGVPALAAAASAGGAPAAGEREWLLRFMKARRAALAKAADPATRKAWAESVSRADAMLAILDSNGLAFSGALTFAVYGDTYTIR